MKSWALKLIIFYRNTLSHFMLYKCNFYPSCSVYTWGSIRRYGLFRGLFCAAKRILRCHPFHLGGYDPVE